MQTPALTRSIAPAPLPAPLAAAAPAALPVAATPTEEKEESSSSAGWVWTLVIGAAVLAAGAAALAVYQLHPAFAVKRKYGRITGGGMLNEEDEESLGSQMSLNQGTTSRELSMHMAMQPQSRDASLITTPMPMPAQTYSAPTPIGNIVDNGPSRMSMERVEHRQDGAVVRHVTEFMEVPAGTPGAVPISDDAPRQAAPYRQGGDAYSNYPNGGGDAYSNYPNYRG
jgi:hypothetical protein